MTAIEIFVGNRSPSLTDTITSGGVPFNLAGSTVKLRMRLANGATLKIDSPAVVVSAPNGTIRYDWAALDVDTAGRYMAWWHVTLGNGITQDSPEFEVDVLAHDVTTKVDLCTLADVKLAAGLPDSRDSLIEACITQASVAIAHRYQREFVDSGAGATRRFDLESTRVSLAPYDLQSASLIQLNPETSSPITLTVNDGVILRPTTSMTGTYRAIDISGLQTIISSTTIRWGIAYLDVTGVWGFPSIPDDVRRACVVTVAAWLDRAAATYGMDTDGTPGQNTAAMAQTWGIPTAAHRLLSPYESLEYA